MSCRLVVLNLANCDDDPRWPERRAMVVAALRPLQLDAVLLQEVRYDAQRCGALDMASQLAQALDLHCSLAIAQYYSPATLKPVDAVTSVWEGSAVLSRRRPRTVGQLNLAPSSGSSDKNHRVSQRVALAPSLSINSMPLTLVNVHLSTDEAELTTHLSQTLFWMREEGVGAARLCAGDMNAEPSVVTPLLRADNLVDAWLIKQPSAPGYTFPSAQPCKRIDYLWVDRTLAAALQRVELILTEPRSDGLYASDHLGLLAEFAL